MRPSISATTPHTEGFATHPAMKAEAISADGKSRGKRWWSWMPANASKTIRPQASASAGSASRRTTAESLLGVVFVMPPSGRVRGFPSLRPRLAPRREEARRPSARACSAAASTRAALMTARQTVKNRQPSYDKSVTTDRWTDFVEWARRARAKPAFDVEERGYRLRVAAALQ